MKFRCSVDIDVPRDFAVELFADKSNLPDWQPEFLSVESIDGNPGQSGTTTWMKYQSGKHKFDLYETVRTNNLPQEFVGEYETPGTCWNTMRSTFVDTAKDKTHYEAEIEYKFYGFMIRMMALFMPRVFRKQTQKYLDNFKVFAEREFNRAS